MPKKRAELFATVTIDDYSAKGYGVGTAVYDDAKRLQAEVPFTMPGDVLMASLGRKRRGKAQGRMLELMEAAPLRCEARCAHFADCGGCRWQHLPYAAQIQQKETWLRGYFDPICDVDAVVHSMVPCPASWAYRNKMEFSFSHNAAGDRFLGLMKQGGGQKVLNLNECHLVNPWFTEALALTRKWWEASDVAAYHPYRDTGSLRTLTVREGTHTGDRLLMLTVSGNPDYALDRGSLDALVALWKDSLTPNVDEGRLSLYVREQRAIKGQPTCFVEECLSGPSQYREQLHIDVTGQPTRVIDCGVSPSAFFQTNTRQAERLYASVIELAELSSADCVYDLYCGTGTLGLVAAPYVRSVVGVELVPEAVRDARANAEINGVTNTEFYCGDAAKVLEELANREGVKAPDVVFVDPPRPGLGKAAIEQVGALAAPKLVYVSCNPKTQALDIKELSRFGYQLELLKPFDQFPHTVHMETIAVLRRNS